MARQAPEFLQRVHPGILVAIPVVLVVIVFVVKLTRRVVVGEGPEVAVQKYLQLCQDKKAGTDALYFVSRGSSYEPPPSGGKAGTRRSSQHLELEHFIANEMPGTAIRTGTPKFSGSSDSQDETVEVPLLVRVGTLDFTIPVYMVKEEGEWKIDLTRTNAEIQKQEQAINNAQIGASVSGEGGLRPGSSFDPGLPPR